MSLQSKEVAEDFKELVLIICKIDIFQFLQLYFYIIAKLKQIKHKHLCSYITLHTISNSLHHLSFNLEFWVISSFYVKFRSEDIRKYESKSTCLLLLLFLSWIVFCCKSPRVALLGLEEPCFFLMALAETITMAEGNQHL